MCRSTTSAGATEKTPSTRRNVTCRYTSASPNLPPPAPSLRLCQRGLPPAVSCNCAAGHAYARSFSARRHGEHSRHHGASTEMACSGSSCLVPPPLPPLSPASCSDHTHCGAQLTPQPDKHNSYAPIAGTSFGIACASYPACTSRLRPQFPSCSPLSMSHRSCTLRSLAQANPRHQGLSFDGAPQGR